MAKEVTGIIDHRILLNFRIDPEIMDKQLPPQFTPKIVHGYAIGGICQVSLSEMRPKGMPAISGTNSHNAAHRIAVETSQGEGVYVLRRDTSSWLNTVAGGRLFPGIHSKAHFDIAQANGHYSVKITDSNNDPIMSIRGEVARELPNGSIFHSTQEVSDFFKTGNIGWSPRGNDSDFDTIELQTKEWDMEPLHLEESFSSYFSDTNKFPSGSVEFDSGMIMRNLKHSWIARDRLCDVCG
ncbi:DUF2071 domain-containing protein [Rubritalea marina]|uniref:DUF2071 domain-containing protein n=1 Tax=Rubritalea marina TaxID=361055 RepID=UPI00036E5563|nr:DUF2071 domain-containing protein [Rubritalea marina]